MSDTGELRRIGQVADMLGVSTRTLRHYEEMGLLRPQSTTNGGFRLYSEADVERVKRIIQLKETLNFRLDEVLDVIQSDDELESLKEKGRDQDPGFQVEVLDSILALLEHQGELALQKKMLLEEFLEDLGVKIAKVHEHRTRCLALVREQEGAVTSSVGRGSRATANAARKTR
jgi:DNA-binding transcriptional MerR regulator